MIQQITEERRLKDYIAWEIEDAGIEVGVSPDLSRNEYVGIKVDDFYNGLKLMGETPKSVDYIVAVDCSCNDYILYVLELKNVKSPSGYQSKDIMEKFENTIYGFMSEEFKEIFLNDRYKYRDVQLYLVTTAYKAAIKYDTYEEYEKIMRRIGKMDSLIYDVAFSQKPLRFRNKILYIKREIPPNPIIVKKYA